MFCRTHHAAAAVAAAVRPAAVCYFLRVLLNCCERNKQNQRYHFAPNTALIVRCTRVLLSMYIVHHTQDFHIYEHT